MRERTTRLEKRAGMPKALKGHTVEVLSLTGDLADAHSILAP